MPSRQAQLLRQLEVSPSHPSRQEGVRHSATTSSPTLSIAELDTDTMLAKAVDAQRQDIITQAGPSNSLHLKALNKLQQRGFKPAAGGIEIPFTPNSLLGGGGSKRVDVIGTTSSHIQVNLDAVIEDLERQIKNNDRAVEVLNRMLQREEREEKRNELIGSIRRLEAESDRFGDRLEDLVIEKGHRDDPDSYRPGP